MKTYLLILIIGQSATTISTNSLEHCIKLQENIKAEANKQGIKEIKYGCFEELGGRKKDI